MKRTLIFLLGMTLGILNHAWAQSELPNREVRAVWVSTVYNLDWPQGSGLSESMKMNDLKTKLQKLKEAGINTVYFQVRTYGDAMFESPYEPWSEFLTGEEGQAPDPLWDPLEVAVEEAHKLGMELHAWFNPYRSMNVIPGDFSQKIVAGENLDPVDESLLPFRNRYYDENAPKYKGTTAHDEKHVSNTHPDWLLILKNANGVDDLAILDPGLPEVREYVSKIVADVVRRYDVDGVHFDDYFYPYPENGMHVSYNTNLDDSSYNLNPRGFAEGERADWRRDNVNIFIAQVNDSIKTVKPWVKFGISPFGIYGISNPFGISGLNSYAELFIDPLQWASEGSVDYLMPQLYWKFGGAQDFEKLAKWWGKEIAEKRGRHLYPGTAPYRADNATFSGTLYAADEIPRQIQYTRDNENLSGVSFFRMMNLTNYNTKGLKDSLKVNYFRRPAIVPTMEWLDTAAPATPQNLITAAGGEPDIFEVSWSRPDGNPYAKTKDLIVSDTLLKYAVYRVEGSQSPDVYEVIANPENRVALTGELNFADKVESHSGGHIYYVVTSVSRNGVESDPTDAVDAGVLTSKESESAIARGFQLQQNYPNPFNPSTRISYNIGKPGPVSIKVYDILGREVATLVNEFKPMGAHSVMFDASSLSSGIYLYRLRSDNVVLTRRLTLVK